MKKLLGLSFMVFLAAAAAGFIGHEMLTSSGYVKSVDVEVDAENDIAEVRFDGHFLELRYEDSDKAAFYYAFNDSRNVQQIRGIIHDGTLRRKTDIKSFGNQTYLLHFKYQDNPEKSGDGWLKLYKIEEA